jgi:predicted phage baseplate assembly protein
MTHNFNSDSPQLDKNLSAQALDAALRQRIVTLEPGWATDDTGDSGMTLISLFSRMTEQLGERLNLVPHKNYLEFLKLLGAEAVSPRQATVELTFYLVTPFPLPVPGAAAEFDYVTRAKVPAVTEVATRRSTADDPEISFTTDEELIIAGPRLAQVRVENEFENNRVLPLEKWRKTNQANPSERPRSHLEVFHKTPRQKDDSYEDAAFYLGFDLDVSGYILQLDFWCVEGAGGVGINGEDPPLVWEGSMGDDLQGGMDGQPAQKWQRANRLTPDQTQGFNKDGTVQIHLPLSMQPTTLNNTRAYWVRCRVHQANSEQGMYTQSPRIQGIQVSVLGATTRATHATPIPAERLGVSNGDPGQTFQLLYSPILPLESGRGERLEIRSTTPDGEVAIEQWTQVSDFSGSGPEDNHFTVNLVDGEVRFGPVVPQPDGSARQYGAIPPMHHEVWMNRYRQGGGRQGNVPRETLRVLKSSISYVVDVINWSEATGGADAEQLDAVARQVHHQLETRQRAVTPVDYERLVSQAGGIARVKCLPSGAAGVLPGTVKLLVAPELQPATATPESDEEDGQPAEGEQPTGEERAARRKAAQRQRAYQWLARLAVNQALQQRLADRLEPHRVLGIMLNISAPAYIAVKIETVLQCEPFAAPDVVVAAVGRALEAFITPVPWPDPESQAEGEAWVWPFGQNLYKGDVFAKIQAVPGVSRISQVTLRWSSINLEQVAEAIRSDNQLPPPPQWSEDTARVVVPPDGLLFLLEHDVRVEE